MQDLAVEIRSCRICRDAPRGKPLPQEPKPIFVLSTSARIAICGQAPGTLAHHSGKPFSDPSGVRLRDWLGVDERRFYDPDNFAIVPMGFCFPGQDAKGGDLPPRRECRAAWHDRIFPLMPQLQLLIVIGQYARDYHLPHLKREKLSDIVADWRTVLGASAPDRRVLVLPHPSWRNNAWLKRNPWFERELLPELRNRVAELTSA